MLDFVNLEFVKMGLNACFFCAGGVFALLGVCFKGVICWIDLLDNSIFKNRLLLLKTAVLFSENCDNRIICKDSDTKTNINMCVCLYIYLLNNLSKLQR